MIEDCAHALGSRHGSNHAGTFGLAGCFSFQAEKLIGIGQGGMVITNSDRIAGRIRELKNQGWRGPKSGEGGDAHPSLGFNFRMTDYQAALALGQLQRIGEKIQEKWEADCIWTLCDMDCTVHGSRDEIPIWKVARFARNEVRERAFTAIRAMGVECRRHYPPLHRQPPFGGAGDLPVSSMICDTELWLPNNRFVTKEIARKVAEIIHRECA